MAVYNKPLIYYPLSVLMLAGIRDVLIVSTPEDQDRFVRLLGDGSRIGMSFSYAAQPKPEGLAQAFIIGREFVGNGSCALVLGDNMFYGTGLTPMLQRAMARAPGCTVYAYLVNDPERYGVVEFDDAGKPVACEIRRGGWSALRRSVKVSYFYVWAFEVSERGRVW